MPDVFCSLSPRLWLSSASATHQPAVPADRNTAKPMSPSKPRLDPDRVVGLACVAALLVAIILI